jgi:hypothetical protein
MSYPSPEKEKTLWLLNQRAFWGKEEEDICICSWNTTKRAVHIDAD